VKTRETGFVFAHELLHVRQETQAGTSNKHGGARRLMCDGM